jgi:SAM-dependent methyltransferase
MGIWEVAYPDRRFAGFTQVDGTVHFLSRAQAMALAARRVLDIGCGRGCMASDPSPFRRQMRDFRRGDRHVLGIDVDPDARANTALDEFRLIADSERWPVEDMSIDFAMSDNVLEHVNDPTAYFREVSRVLRPGGMFIARTPNALSYPVLCSRMIPNAWHARVLSGIGALKSRTQADVFPTVYRANSRRATLRLLASAGLAGCAYTIEGEPAYVQFSSLAFRLMSKVHAVMPPLFRSTLIIMAQKPIGPREADA